MIDPTSLQAARLAVGHIRHTWPRLAGDRDTPTRSTHGAISERAAAARDAELRAERADREATTKYVALRPTPALANLAVVDAQIETLAAITAAAWAIRSDLRQWSRAIPAIPAPVDGKLTWLTGMLAATAPEVVDQAARDLHHAAGRLAGAAGLRLDDDWHPAGRCPTCGLRALYAWRESTDPREWTVECRGEPLDDRERPHPCRCAGPSCPCQRPGARAGSRHLWPA